VLRAGRRMPGPRWSMGPAAGCPGDSTQGSRSGVMAGSSSFPAVLGLELRSRDSHLGSERHEGLALVKPILGAVARSGNESPEERAWVVISPSSGPHIHNCIFGTYFCHVSDGLSMRYALTRVNRDAVPE
jgi:hypothetical protein